MSIYLDHNATTPLLPEVAEAMAACEADGYGNPSSQHALGRKARRRLEDAREGIAELLGADLRGPSPDRLIFTSGGTEANHLALLGLGGGAPGHLITSPLEHPSLLGATEILLQRGWRRDLLPVSPRGDVQPDAVQALWQPDTRLVSLMLGNNETGVLQPVAEVAAMCRQRGVFCHTDAVQVVGKLPVNFRELGVTALSVAAHKFHGPRGIGALLLQGGEGLEPQLRGGFQQWGLRPGTEPVSLAVGMHTALRMWHDERETWQNRLITLRDRLEAALRPGDPLCSFNGAEAERLPHTSSVTFHGLDGQSLLMALDLAGVACSLGSACASGSSEPSPTLLAMGLTPEAAGASLRFSLGATTTEAEVDEASQRILKVLHDFRSRPAPGEKSPRPRESWPQSL